MKHWYVQYLLKCYIVSLLLTKSISESAVVASIISWSIRQKAEKSVTEPMLVTGMMPQPKIMVHVIAVIVMNFGQCLQFANGIMA